MKSKSCSVTWEIRDGLNKIGLYARTACFDRVKEEYSLSLARGGKLDLPSGIAMHVNVILPIHRIVFEDRCVAYLVKCEERRKNREKKQNGIKDESPV